MHSTAPATSSSRSAEAAENATVPGDSRRLAYYDVLCEKVKTL